MEPTVQQVVPTVGQGVILAPFDAYRITYVWSDERVFEVSRVLESGEPSTQASAVFGFDAFHGMRKFSTRQEFADMQHAYLMQ